MCRFNVWTRVVYCFNEICWVLLIKRWSSLVCLWMRLCIGVGVCVLSGDQLRSRAPFTNRTNTVRVCTLGCDYRFCDYPFFSMLRLVALACLYCPRAQLRSRALLLVTWWGRTAWQWVLRVVHYPYLLLIAHVRLMIILLVFHILWYYPQWYAVRPHWDSRCAGC